MFTMFTIGNRQYHLKFTANAVCELERIAGCGLGELMDKGEVSGVRLLLWAALLHQENITLEQVGGILDGGIAQNGSLRQLCDVLKMALEQAGFAPLGEHLGAESPKV